MGANFLNLYVFKNFIAIFIHVNFSKKERLAIFYHELAKAPPANSAEEALELVFATLEAVEDQYSGLPKEPNPDMKASERMYRAEADKYLPQS